ncbi:SIP domain-containing protein [Herbiconiux moechotypicola]|uniref:SIP-like Rossmann fold domain-containing protein n=1 Tax=Herbiconiux moechotypicola TaxID=637393 RepID=A0ABP5QFF9_9MICO|nr:SIP domain-containing protein [Herbiconiux moechotypicola]MCS5729994.1 SIP domain-containing protein [Herbiconiux moechotypicola]
METFSLRDGESAHVLLAGDTGDLPSIRRILDELPDDAYGQVYLEIVSPIQIRPIDRPEGVSLTWLRRDLVPHGLREIAPRGELIRSAVSAWVSEWMPEAPAEGGDRIHLWVGCTASPRVGTLYRELASKLSSGASDDR